MNIDKLCGGETAVPAVRSGQHCNRQRRLLCKSNFVESIPSLQITFCMPPV